jgi:hypothetical protein
VLLLRVCGRVCAAIVHGVVIMRIGIAIAGSIQVAESESVWWRSGPLFTIGVARVGGIMIMIRIAIIIVVVAIVMSGVPVVLLFFGKESCHGCVVVVVVKRV